jgi:site-specific recombinase XerD
MRIERAIDAFLDWRQLERDASRRSIESYRAILDKLANAYPEMQLSEFEGGEGTARLREFLRAWAKRSASTRCNVISVMHSFFRWAESEDLIVTDPSRKIQRPPKRKPDISIPTAAELQRLRMASTVHERPAILLMEGVGLHRSEVVGCRWADIDLLQGRIRVLRKGQDWHRVPVDPDVLLELRVCYRAIEPDLDDYVFVAEVEQWVSQHERERRRTNPKQPSSDQALWRLVRRVCQRAGLRPLSPHQLRHGFANRFLHESGQNFGALQGLLGHSRIDTTQAYVDEIELEELAAALELAALRRHAQASPDLATLGDPTLKYPRNPVMEAAGIEPASADAPTKRLQA